MKNALTLFFVAALFPLVGSASPAAAENTGTDPAEQCPSLVIVSARGSEEEEAEQNGTGLTSDGWEGPTIHRFLSFASSAHPTVIREENVSLFGIDDGHYPARFPVPDDLEGLTGAQLSSDTALLTDSLVRGVPGGLDQVKAWESSTGCRPDYITVGYSQGVLPVVAVQQWAAQNHRLRGVVVIGSPVGGVPGQVTPVLEAPPGVPSMNICAVDDVVCAPGERSFRSAVADEDDIGVHADYFKAAVSGQPTALEQEAVDTLAGWISQPMNRTNGPS